jgi:hypothetical protein
MEWTTWYFNLSLFRRVYAAEDRRAIAGVVVAGFAWKKAFLSFRSLARVVQSQFSDLSWLTSCWERPWIDAFSKRFSDKKRKGCAAKGTYIM